MKRKSEKKQYPDTWEHSTYQTGSTTPPKQHSPLVVILLVLVIFLSGLSSILGLINIKLFSAFYEDQMDEIPVSLENSSDLAQQDEQVLSQPDTKMIGITGEPVTPVYQRHFHLPEGLFITYVEKGTSAHRQGIREGDVLICLGETKITEEQHIQDFMEDRAIGDTFSAVIYRRDTDSRITVQLTIEEASS